MKAIIIEPDFNLNEKLYIFIDDLNYLAPITVEKIGMELISYDYENNQYEMDITYGVSLDYERFKNSELSTYIVERCLKTLNDFTPFKANRLFKTHDDFLSNFVQTNEGFELLINH